jgi:diadenosine tetraphosphate (Ap4A) HIT family hydrolase
MRTEDFETAYFDNIEYFEYLKAENAAGRCLICNLVNGPTELPVVYRDDLCLAFFNPHPRLLGYLFVAPVAHRTAVMGDFSEAEYLDLQRRVYRLGRAVSDVVPTERLYVLSFGSNQGLEHVHWHLAPLPAGTPFDSQQFEAISRAAYLRIPESDQLALAEMIRSALTPL